ncbi:MAG TPA: hypothetical protein VGC92_03675, partial [Phenylobacterium sp.]
GVYYLHLWAGNTLVGVLAGQLEKMPAVQFWLLHAALVGGAGVIFFFVRLVFGGLLHGQPGGLDPVSVATADAGKTP